MFSGIDNVQEAVASPVRRHFTVERATRALTLVQRIVRDVMDHFLRLGELQEMLEAASGSLDANKRRIESDVIQAAGRLRNCLDELEAVGVELKDWSVGIVDFPSLAGGREVCLCWRPEDGAIGYWHEVDEDPAARRPLETLPVSAEAPATLF